jgi:hypothetical protein
MHKTRIGMADSNIVGEVGMLIRDVEPFEARQVRFQKPLLGSEEWDCIADSKPSNPASASRCWHRGQFSQGWQGLKGGNG